MNVAGSKSPGTAMARFVVLILLFFVPFSVRAQGDLILPSDLASISITRADSGVAPGNVFAAPLDADHSSLYRLILNDSDEVVYYERSEQTVPSYFVPDTAGNRIVWYSTGGRGFQILDTTMTPVDTLRIGTYGTNPHDLQFLPNGHVLMIGYDPREIDMSELVEGGDPGAQVAGVVICEYDPVSETFPFLWKSLDHQDELPITDSNSDLTISNIDYLHPNSVEMDGDSAYIVSMRHTDQVIKIDKTTGGVIWKLGGDSNDFKFVDEDHPFSMQHYARRLNNGHLMIFDNGSGNIPSFARAVEYELDELAMTARKVWSFDHDKSVTSLSRGNASRLPNGNTFIGWGEVLPGMPNATEVTPSGDIVWELTFGPSPLNGEVMITYQMHRAPVEVFVTKPRVMWLREETGGIQLLFAKFGDDAVTGYEVYTGAAPNTLGFLRQTTSTRILVSTLMQDVHYQYFQVFAQYEDGSKSEGSEVLEVDIESLGVGDFVRASLPDSWGTVTSWPNPFNQTANVLLTVARTGRYQVDLFTVTGRFVRSLHRGRLHAGSRAFALDAGGLASGVYLLRVQARGHTPVVKRLTLLK